MKTKWLTGSLLSWVFLIAVFGIATAQITPLPDSIPASSYRQLSSDNNDNLYFVTAQGEVIRHPSLRFSPVRQSSVTLLNTANPLRLFIFYQDLQEYVILDRFLTESARYDLRNISGFTAICAPSLNNQIWLVDMTNFALVKYDPQRNQQLINVPLQQIMKVESAEFIDLIEYRNYLFLTDKNSGIYVFDNLGNFLRSIPVTTSVPPMLFREQLFCLTEDRLYMENIFNGETSTLDLPHIPQDFTVNNSGLWLLCSNVIRHYSF